MMNLGKDWTIGIIFLLIMFITNRVITKLCNKPNFDYNKKKKIVMIEKNLYIIFTIGYVIYAI